MKIKVVDPNTTDDNQDRGGCQAVAARSREFHRREPTDGPRLNRKETRTRPLARSVSSMRFAKGASYQVRSTRDSVVGRTGGERLCYFRVAGGRDLLRHSARPRPAVAAEKTVELESPGSIEDIVAATRSAGALRTVMAFIVRVIELSPIGQVLRLRNRGARQPHVRKHAERCPGSDIAEGWSPRNEAYISSMLPQRGHSFASHAHLRPSLRHSSSD